MNFYFPHPTPLIQIWTSERLIDKLLYLQPHLHANPFSINHLFLKQITRQINVLTLNYTLTRISNFKTAQTEELIRQNDDGYDVVVVIQSIECRFFWE